jgi:hypothetical protein
MNMQTLEKGDFAAQNYTAVSVNQRVMSRSSSRLFSEQAGIYGSVKRKKSNGFRRNAGLNSPYRQGWQMERLGRLSFIQACINKQPIHRCWRKLPDEEIFYYPGCG